jgi:aminoglycoside phosphotransferase (APT) family kinase protein
MEVAMAAQLGKAIAMGSRSVIHEWGDGGGSVAKVPKDSTPEGWMRFEANYTAALHKCGAPVPEVFGVEVVNGREVSVMERIHGPSLWDVMVDAPQHVDIYGRQLGELHLNLLALRPPISLPSQKSRLACKIRIAVRTINPRIAKVLDLLPPVTKVALCHGDFHPKNVLMSPRGPVVVDWFDVSRGEAIGDIARTSLLLGGHVAKSDVTHLPGASTSALRALHDAYLETVLAGFPSASLHLEPWRVVEAAARLAEDTDRPALLQFLKIHGVIQDSESGNAESRQD